MLLTFSWWAYSAAPSSWPYELFADVSKRFFIVSKSNLKISPQGPFSEPADLICYWPCAQRDFATPPAAAWLFSPQYWKSEFLLVLYYFQLQCCLYSVYYFQNLYSYAARIHWLNQRFVIAHFLRSISPESSCDLASLAASSGLDPAGGLCLIPLYFNSGSQLFGKLYKL